MSDIIAHYGVKGMHWGIRNDRPSGSVRGRLFRKSAKVKERYAVKRQAKGDTRGAKALRRSANKDYTRAKYQDIRKERIQAASRMNRMTMSKTELEARVSRLQTEKQLRELTNSELRSGQQEVSKTLKQIGGGLAVTAGTAVTLYVAGKRLQKAPIDPGQMAYDLGGKFVKKAIKP